jgi:histidinol-phosphatase (PHP family)
MELTDTHMHTWLSGHGIGTVEELVQTSCDRGFTTIAITEHLPLPVEVDPDGTFAMTEDQVCQYLEEIETSRARHPEIELIGGIEVDWREGAESYILERLGPYEIVLGSVHMFTVCKDDIWAFDHPDYIEGWLERGEENVWREYFRLWCDAVLSTVPFTIMSHPDLPKKLGFKPVFDPREMYLAMAEIAASKDLLVEVNTSGLFRPVAEPYPAPALLKAFCDAGVGCTVSSDAHNPGHIGRGFDMAYAAMRAAGYKHVTVPTRTGDRRTISLDL